MFHSHNLNQITPDQRDFLVPALKSGAFEPLIALELKDLREQMTQMNAAQSAEKLQEQYRYLKAKEASLLQFLEFINQCRENLGA